MKYTIALLFFIFDMFGIDHIDYPKNVNDKKQIALIIANSNYAGYEQLEQSIPVAIKMKNTLKSLGFEVLMGVDMTQNQMESIFKEFSKKYIHYDLAMISYMGHGFELDGRNYLIPIDADPYSKDEVVEQAVNLGSVLEKLDNPKTAKMIILDACKGNPFTKNWDSAKNTDAGGGFRNLNSNPNQKIVITSQKNSTINKNNPYIDYFTQELNKGGCLDYIIKNINKKIQSTNPNQVPITYGKMLKKFCFGGRSQTLIPNNSISSPPPPTTIASSSAPWEDHKIEVVNINGITFSKNCTGMETDCYTRNGNSMRDVTITPFKMSAYETTNAQFIVFLNDYGVAPDGSYQGIEYIDLDDSHCRIGYSAGRFFVKKGYSIHPVIEVTWYGAEAYAEWAGGRLPTEEEWEYAAKGGHKSRGYKYSGGNYLDVVAWYDANSNKTTHPVGQKRANELGLFDMSGNVWEWCWDIKIIGAPPKSTKSKSESDTLNIEESKAEPSTNRVLRGGSWTSSARNARVYYRNHDAPNNSTDYYGFRVVYDPPEN